MMVSEHHWFIFRKNKCIAYTDTESFLKGYIETKEEVYTNKPEKLKEFTIRHYHYDNLPEELRKVVDMYNENHSVENYLEICQINYGSKIFYVSADDEMVIADYMDRYAIELNSAIENLKEYSEYINLGENTTELLNNMFNVLKDYLDYLAEEEDNGDVAEAVDAWGIYKQLVEKEIMQ